VSGGVKGLTEFLANYFFNIPFFMIAMGGCRNSFFHVFLPFSAKKGHSRFQIPD